MRERTMILWVTLSLLLEVPSDTFGGATRSFTQPISIEQDTQFNIVRCCRCTPVTWECTDFILSQDLH